MELKSADVESEYKTRFNEDGSIRFIKKEDADSGRKSKKSGGAFEARARKDLEEKGWIVDKWSNNVDIAGGEIVPCKRIFRKFNANMGVMTIGTGFPDFVCFQKMDNGLFKIIGVEVKMNGTLSRIEKEKCAWYLKNEIFSEILIASKIQEKKGAKITIEYIDVSEILGRMRS